MKITTTIKIKKFCSYSSCSNYRSPYNKYRQNKAKYFAKKNYWKVFRRKNRNSISDDILLPRQYMGWYFD